MELDQFIDRAKSLPPAPTLLPELLELLGDPDTDGDRVVRLVTYDPTLTANVLRLCNSAALGLTTPVPTLSEAILRLGYGQIFRLVVASCGAKSMRSGPNQQAIQRQLWSHSVVSAVGAQKIAKDRGVDENLSFTAALLHDIGKIVMLDVLEDKYTRLLAESKQHGQSLVDAEKRLFGLHHAELGGRLLARWKFPLSLSAAVCFHYNPAAAGVHRHIAACVSFGNLIADINGYTCNNPTATARGQSEAFELLNLKRGDEIGYSNSVRDQFASIQALIVLGE